MENQQQTHTSASYTSPCRVPFSYMKMLNKVPILKENNAKALMASCSMPRICLF